MPNELQEILEAASALALDSGGEDLLTCIAARIFSPIKFHPRNPILNFLVEHGRRAVPGIVRPVIPCGDHWRPLSIAADIHQSRILSRPGNRRAARTFKMIGSCPSTTFKELKLHDFDPGDRFDLLAESLGHLTCRGFRRRSRCDG